MCMKSNIEVREIPDNPIQNIIDDYEEQISEDKLIQEERINRKADEIFNGGKN